MLPDGLGHINRFGMRPHLGHGSLLFRAQGIRITLANDFCLNFGAPLRPSQPATTVSLQEVGAARSAESFSVCAFGAPASI